MENASNLSNSANELKNSDRGDTIWQMTTSEAQNVVMRLKNIDITGIDLISLKKPLTKPKSNFQGSNNPSPNSSDYQIHVSFSCLFKKLFSRIVVFPFPIFSRIYFLTTKS